MAFLQTRFRASDGTEYLGFSLHAKLGLVAPVIVTEAGHIPLYFPDGRPTDREALDAYQRLDIAADRLFPVTLIAEVRTRNAPLNDMVEGFAYRDTDGVHEFR